jgi:hypothetical protein
MPSPLFSVFRGRANMIVRLGARGFGIAFFISVCLFYLITQLRLESCYDCFRPHGFPFTYFHEGGYAGGSAWVGRA